MQPAYQAYPQYAPYQQAPPAGGEYYPPPNNYLVFGIITTIFCFMPFGIVSIIKATSVNTLWAQGRAAEAYRAAAQAKNWAIAALVALPVFFGGFMLLALVGALAS
jgi:TRAP-type mannitol/chloroaromatic compound transport system permease small subunit